MNSFKKKSKKAKIKRDKKGKKDRKRRRSSSSSSDSSISSSSSSTSSSSVEKQKRKKHKKDHKRKKAKSIYEKYRTGGSSKRQTEVQTENPVKSDDDNDFSIPIHLMDNKQKAPETKEEYEKRQSIIRRVVDEETGRTRLIKGDGEVIEEIVSRDRHRDINKLATQTDGQVYQNKSIGAAATSNKK